MACVFAVSPGSHSDQHSEHFFKPMDGEAPRVGADLQGAEQKILHPPSVFGLEQQF